MTDLLGCRDQEQPLAEQPKALQHIAQAPLCTPKLREVGCDDFAPLFWCLALSLLCFFRDVEAPTMAPPVLLLHCPQTVPAACTLTEEGMHVWKEKGGMERYGEEQIAVQGFVRRYPEQFQGRCAQHRAA